MTTTPAAALADRERKAAEDKEQQEELERRRLAAEQARQEEGRKQAAASYEKGVEFLARSLRAAFLIVLIVVAISGGWFGYRALLGSRTTRGALSGEELLTLRGHSSPVSAVAFSPDGKRLATANSDQTATLWGVEP